MDIEKARSDIDEGRAVIDEVFEAADRDEFSEAELAKVDMLWRAVEDLQRRADGGAVPFVHVVNRYNETDPLYVFEREEDARAFAARDADDTTVSEEVIITAADAPKFLAETADEGTA